jgi:hypothetical protein
MNQSKHKAGVPSDAITYFKNLASKPREPRMPMPRHLLLRDPTSNLAFYTRPSGEGSVLSEKTFFFPRQRGW